MNIDPERNVFKPDLSADELAAIVRDEIRQAQLGSASALAHGIAAGEALLAAQHKVSAGGWKKWVHDNCAIGESTARLYMQLAKHRDEIEAEIGRGVDLSLRAARRLIATPSEDKEPKQRQRKELETLLAHWERCPEERKEFLDQVAVAGILEAISPGFAQQLRAAAVPANPFFSKLRDMNAAAIADAIFGAVDRTSCKEIIRKLQAKLQSKTVHLSQDQYRSSSSVSRFRH